MCSTLSRACQILQFWNWSIIFPYQGILSKKVPQQKLVVGSTTTGTVTGTKVLQLELPTIGTRLLQGLQALSLAVSLILTSIIIRHTLMSSSLNSNSLFDDHHVYMYNIVSSVKFIALYILWRNPFPGESATMTPYFVFARRTCATWRSSAARPRLSRPGLASTATRG